MDISLERKIEVWLTNHRKSHGGFAQILDQDVTDLYIIIHKLIELKCNADPYGDYPIDVKLINRRKYRPMFYYSIPYSGKLDIMDILLSNAKIAVSDLHEAMKDV